MTKHAPLTRNLRAAALIAEAQRVCPGCRVSWRLDGWLHVGPRPRMECRAKPIRQELRDIAAARRSNKPPRASTSIGGTLPLRPLINAARQACAMPMPAGATVTLACPYSARRTPSACREG